MRHLKRGKKLSRTSSHRKALLRNLAANLIYEERIITSPEKAKEARPFVERLITLGKRGGLANYRRAISRLRDEDAAHKLFHEIADRFKDTPGGYTRILHLADRRLGDGSSQVIFELVKQSAEKKQRKKKPKEKVEQKASEEST